MSTLLESRILGRVHVEPETSDPRWSRFDEMGIEIETAELLYGLVRAVKPVVVVECGSHPGIGTQALWSALKDNGGGRLICSEEHDFFRQGMAVKFPEVEFVAKVLPEEFAQAGFIFLDSGAVQRPVDFRAAEEHARPGTLICIHDTLAGQHVSTTMGGVLIRTPRGLTVYQK